RSSSAAALAVKPGAVGTAWKLTSGAGKGVGVRLDGVAKRLSVETGLIADGESGRGKSFQRQNRPSSITSQLLHLPAMASANTPFVGTLRRRGGDGSTVYRRSSASCGFSFSLRAAASTGSSWNPAATGITSELPTIPISRFSTTDATERPPEP